MRCSDSRHGNIGIFEADCGPFTPADGACSRQVFLLEKSKALSVIGKKAGGGRTLSFGFLFLPESHRNPNGPQIFFNQPHTITEFFPGPLHNFSILPHIQPLGVCIIIPPLSVHLSVVLENLIIRKHPTMADSMQKTIRNFSKVILILFICYLSVVTMVARVH